MSMISKCPVCGEGYGPEKFCRCMRRKWRLTMVLLLLLLLSFICSWARRNAAPPARVNVSLLQAEAKARAAMMLAEKDEVVSLYYSKWGR